MFINYDIDTGFSINSFRKPDAVACEDVRDLFEEIGRGHNAVCGLDGAKDALEDGALWTDTEQEFVEDLHALICDHEGKEEDTDPENIYDLDCVRQSIEEDRK